MSSIYFEKAQRFSSDPDYFYIIWVSQFENCGTAYLRGHVCKRQGRWIAVDISQATADDLCGIADKLGDLNKQEECAKPEVRE